MLKLGHIIRKMTEILIEEYDRSSRRLRDEQVRDRFLADLLFIESLDAHSARAQARTFGIDLKAPACVAVIETMAQLQLTDPVREGQTEPSRDMQRESPRDPQRESPRDPQRESPKDAVNQKSVRERLLDEIRWDLTLEGGVAMSCCMVRPTS